ncbi:MAG: hypothetical protein KJ023_00270 [Burkholderiaceae bacterium]|nr:hypothetical protein [Burkholderiaceae bacterium]
MLAALMREKGLGSLPLARAIGKPALQAPIHRFMHGNVAAPEPSTARPIAAYFSLPLEALYDEKVAAKVARERGLSVVATPTSSTPRKRSSAPQDARLITELLAGEDETLDMLREKLERLRLPLAERAAAAQALEKLKKK